MSKVEKGWDGKFADPEVGRVLHANGLIASPTHSTRRELAAIRSLNPTGGVEESYFYNNKVITKFPELQYCTGIINLRYTFRGCSNLTEVILPSGVTNLASTFRDCSSLTKAPVIPSSVTNLSQTFSGCSSLTTAPTIPSSVTSLQSTFFHCYSLTKAPTIPSSVTSLNSTFSSCSSLTTAPIIPEGVTSLYSAFQNCSSLAKAPNIPSSVTSLTYTFHKCSRIDGIYIINIVTPPSYNLSLYNVQAIYVPNASVSAYKSASGWSQFASKIYPMSNKP